MYVCISLSFIWKKKKKNFTYYIDSNTKWLDRIKIYMFFVYILLVQCPVICLGFLIRYVWGKQGSLLENYLLDVPVGANFFLPHQFPKQKIYRYIYKRCIWVFQESLQWSNSVNHIPVSRECLRKPADRHLASRVPKLVLIVSEIKNIPLLTLKVIQCIDYMKGGKILLKRSVILQNYKW